MKINVFHIISAHLDTLRNYSTKKVSLLDILIFYLFPVIFGIIVFLLDFVPKGDFNSLSVTFFGIFIALLLNVQVAIFGIFLRKRDMSEDPLMADIQKDDISLRLQLLRDLNANVSYLIVLSTIGLIWYAFQFELNAKNSFSTAISAAFYTHFVFTLLMIIKRTHALYQGEYDAET